jgi:Flp pilus assembly protein TadD
MDLISKKIMQKLIYIALAVMGAQLFAGCGASRAALYNERGLEVAKYGLWREATIRFQQATEAHPNDARLHNNLAVAYEARGMMKEAEAEYTKAAQLDPHFKIAHENFASFAGDQSGQQPAENIPDEQE